MKEKTIEDLDTEMRNSGTIVDIIPKFKIGDSVSYIRYEDPILFIVRNITVDKHGVVYNSPQKFEQRYCKEITWNYKEKK